MYLAILNNRNAERSEEHNIRILWERLIQKDACKKKKSVWILDLVKNPNQSMAWDFFAMSTMSIEVIKDDVLQKIYYRVKDRVSI